MDSWYNKGTIRKVSEKNSSLR